MSVDMAALHELTQAKAIPLEALIHEIELAIIEAYKETPEPKRQAWARLDKETGEIKIIYPTFDEEGNRNGEDFDEL